MDQVGGFIDPLLNERLLGILSTKENVNLETLRFRRITCKEVSLRSSRRLILRVSGLARCLSTEKTDQYDIDDIILSEYGTTVVGLEMMRSVNEENAEETRKVQIVKSAISTLVIFGIGSDHSYF